MDKCQVKRVKSTFRMPLTGEVKSKYFSGLIFKLQLGKRVGELVG